MVAMPHPNPSSEFDPMHDSVDGADMEIADVAGFERRSGKRPEDSPAGGGRDGASAVDGGQPDTGADDGAGAEVSADGERVEEDDELEELPRPGSEPIRLQKVLASAGIGSRRKCEQLIVEGRVEVDGAVVRELGTRVRPDSAVIRVDGERLNLRSDLVYLAFNKPRGVMSTMSDDKGRESIGTFVEDRAQRLFHVGRLDADSEGLILLTNDGELAHRLTHPRYGIKKTYLAQVAAPVPRNLGRALMRGIELEDGIAKADDYQLLDVSGGRALIQIVLHEGRKHIVRRMLATAGFPVQQLVRTAHGPITLGHLRSGAVRKLTRSELAALYRAVGL
jgi:23S rRNA pseudouridine2605 synthase